MNHRAARIALLTTVLSLSSCLAGSEILTKNIKPVFLPAEADTNHLVIEGNTASHPDYKPFVLPGPYQLDTVYKNAADDEIEFKERQLGAGTATIVEIRPNGGTPFKLYQLPNFRFSGTDHGTAWGFYSSK